MPHRHTVKSREIGQVRIYMTPRERNKPGKGLKNLFGSKPLYMEIINAAKQDGILNATAHHTHYGYSGHGPVMAEGAEIANSLLNLCVELIAPREQLELFVRAHGDLLKDKVIVYKHIEHWELSANRLKASDAAEDEYMEDEPIADAPDAQEQPLEDQP